MENKPGFIIFINGASSAGKSTLAKAVQQAFDLPLLHFSFDLFIDGDILPRFQIQAGKFEWSTIRPHVVRGVHHCWAALSKTGNNLIIDHIVESESQLAALIRLLEGVDVFFAGLHCSAEELERRENTRGNRRSGDARSDLEFVHKWTIYDIELDSEHATIEENVAQLITAWQQRKSPSAFEKMKHRLDTRYI